MNMGLVGAIGGAGKGMADVANMDLEEAKQTRLEELRTRNQRDTNTQDNQQRHDFAVQEADVQHGYRTDEQSMSNTQDLAKLDKSHEYSLAQLAQQNADQTGRLKTASDLRAAEPTNEQKNATFWKDQGGVPLDKQYEDEQSRGYNIAREPDKKVLGDYLLENGASQEDVNAFIMGKKTVDQLRQDMIRDRSKDGVSDPESIVADVDKVLSTMNTKAPTGGSGAPEFKSMGDALEAAKARYPGVDEAVLRQKLAEKFPGLQ